MKKPFYKLYLILGVLLTANISFAQNTISIEYDSNGNRISLSINMKSATIDSIENETPPDGDVDLKNKKIHNDYLGEVKLNIYPNPTRGELEVTAENLPEGTTGKILLYDIKGSLIRETTLKSTTSKLNVADQPQGTYILKFVIGDKVTQWKIVKE